MYTADAQAVMTDQARRLRAGLCIASLRLITMEALCPTPYRALHGLSRSETVPPVSSADRRGPAILVSTTISGFRNGSSIRAAVATLHGIAQANGCGFFQTGNGAAVMRQLLERLRTLSWPCVSGPVPKSYTEPLHRRLIEGAIGWTMREGSCVDA